MFNTEVLIAPDIKHSSEEVRYFAIGVSNQKRLILVVFTFRVKGEETFIRPISARYMHQKEISKYEKDFPNFNK
ncbi:BrnT family toxin [Nostoc favosum]|uniref:BrnT family toxin n=1 Tax=Nostoc favosum CHAB5714 TaxID=2780399 RepID=A0ABS8IG84_9NOSO|nr:BrnT family toxin [Nostoc favosum]MCC5602906.1 BrnT family toxin [Nostoc favosum CHAB5714]